MCQALQLQRVAGPPFQLRVRGARDVVVVAATTAAAIAVARVEGAEAVEVPAYGEDEFAEHGDGEEDGEVEGCVVGGEDFL